MRLRSALSLKQGARIAPIATLSGRETLGRWADGAFFAADLTRNKAFLNYGRRLQPLSGLSGYSFTRATTGYALTQQGQLVQFPSGALRLTDRGCLVEAAATNLCLQSADFSTTWSAVNLLAFGSGSTVNATAAPDGTTTADLITPSTTNAQHRVDQSITISSATSYTVSVYAKPAGYNSLWLRLTDGVGTPASANFNVSTGVVSAAPAGTATITALANGWYRCSITATSAGTSGTFRINVIQDDGTNTFAADGTSGLYLWGAQLEATAYATSYIPTTTASATRNADVLSIGSVSGLAYPVTLFAEWERSSDVGGNQIIMQVDDNSAANRARIQLDSADCLLAFSTASSATQASVQIGAATTVGVLYRGAARFSTNSVQGARSGVLGITEDTLATNPSAPTVIRIGADQTPAQWLNGYIRRLAIYPTAYTDAQLQALTS